MWFFFWSDFSKVYKMQTEFHQLSEQVVALESFKRQLITAKLEISELKRIKRLAETKTDREQAFEEKATIRSKLYRWARQVKANDETGREIVLMKEYLEEVYAKIPQKASKLSAPINNRPRVKHVGLGGSMR